ncbi:hypothetical protein ACWDV4_19745 [Micromonospora sp. NPDC003197]
MLDRQDWYETIRAGLDLDSEFFRWLAENVAARQQLRAFLDAGDVQ